MRFLLVLALSGCTAQGALIGAGVPTNEQLAAQLLSAPTAVCVSVIAQQVQSLAALKQALTNSPPPLLR